MQGLDDRVPSAQESSVRVHQIDEQVRSPCRSHRDFHSDSVGTRVLFGSDSGYYRWSEHSGLLRSFYEGVEHIWIRRSPVSHYFVHIDDLDFIKLTVELHNSVLSEGTVWGAIQLTLKLEQAAFPIQTAIEPAIMSLRMPDSTFKRMKTNPHHVDCTLDNADLDQLRDLYGKNKIIDYTRPVDRQEKIQAAMSEIASEDADERDRAGPSSVAAWRSFVPVQTRSRSPPPRRDVPSPSDMEGEWPSPVRAPDPDIMSLSDRPSPARKQVQFETVYDE